MARTRQELVDRRAGIEAVGDTFTKLDQAYEIDPVWAIRPGYALEKQEVMLSLTPEMAARAYEEWRASQGKVNAGRGGADADEKPYRVENGVAILNLSGPMTKRPTSMSYYFGGTSTVMLGRAIRQAVRDTEVKALLLLTSSPGGQAMGTSDLADEVIKAKAVKPVYSFVDGLSASAAYWVNCVSDGTYASRTSEIGCIGTYAVMRDSSQAAIRAGVEVFVVRDGAFKGAGTSGTVVTAEHRAEFQREVSALNDHFVADVAAGRGLSLAKAKELADGRVHVGKAAEDLGLIDGVMSFDECLQMISSGSVPERKTAGNGTGETAMSNQQSFAERFMALFKEAGLDKEAGTGGPDAVTDPKVTAALDMAYGITARALVAQACGAMDPAIQTAVLPLALVAVKTDGGMLGPTCQAFVQLAANSKSPIDMTKPMIVQVAEQDDQGTAALRKKAAGINAGSVSAINNANGRG